MARLIPSVRRFFTDPFGRKDCHYYEGLSLEDKRKEYKCGDRYVTLDQVVPWSDWRLTQRYRGDNPPSLEPLPEINPALNQKVSIWQGDITRLEIGAIVNAANRSLLGGGGVDGAIHSAAGWSLRDECEKLNGCETGNTKLTSGHRLPAKYILHTVGPINADRDALKSCYETCLQLVEENKIRSVAFSCVATGVYGFPNEEAAHVALETCRSWLEIEDHCKEIERIIFCVFLDIDYKIYQRVMQQYFPRECDIPSEDSLQERLDALKQTPTEDNHDSDEIDISNCQSQLDGSTPPPDTLKSDELHIDQSSSPLNDELSHPEDKSLSPQEGLDDKMTPPKEEDNNSPVEDQQEFKISEEENIQQPSADDSFSDDQFTDKAQQQGNRNTQTIPTLQKSVTAPPKLRNDDDQQ